ncbi:MAG TPA: porin, partial [Nannocystis sp.]
MQQTLLALFLATAPAPPAEVGPWTPAVQPPAASPPALPVPAEPPADATPAAPPTTPVAASPPAASVLAAQPAPTSASDKKPARSPALGSADATVFNTPPDPEFEVTRARYKFGKGFTVASADGRFSLQIRGRLQFRYELSHPGVPDEPTRHAFFVRRFRLLFQGNVFSPFIKYYFQFGFSKDDTQSELPREPGSSRYIPIRDARIQFERLRDFNVWVGQMKVPFSRQRVNSSSALNMPDRSLVNSEFNLSRDLGVLFTSQDLGGLGGRLAYYAGVFMGEGRNAFDLRDFGMLYVGRLEVRPFGKFDDYTEGDLARSKTPGLSIAGAYAYQDRAHGVRGVTGDPPPDGGTTNFHHVNADILLKWRGLSLATAFHLRRGVHRIGGGAVDETGTPIPTAPARQGIGWLGQLGYLVPKIPLELVARYALIRNIYGAASSMPNA